MKKYQFTIAQQPLFGFDDMRPKASLKKIITKERILEVQAMLAKRDSKGAAEALRDIRYKLEALEKRIRNTPEETPKSKHDKRK